MKVFLYLSFLFTFILLANSGSAQLIKCGSDEVRKQLIAEDPQYKKTLEDMDAGIQQYISTHPPTATSFTNGTASTLYYIPCVVHVIYDVDPVTGTTAIGTRYNPTDVNINAAINYINKVYDGTWVGTQGSMLGAGDLQIKFVLATKDPNNAATTGIERVSGASVTGYTANGMKRQTIGADETAVKDLARWDPQRYYNIWTVNKIDGCDGVFCGCTCDAGYIAGFALFPPGLNSAASTVKRDGIVMVAKTLVADNNVLPHELGHMLNLYHNFEGNDPTNVGANTCPLNATPATQGDLCTDTDPVTNPAPLPNNFACRTGINSCVAGGTTSYNDNTEKNFMNYTLCYRLFTNDQKARMQASVATTQRASLATSWANNQGVYPATFATPIAPAVTPSSAFPTAAHADYSGTLAITLNGRTIYSLNASEESMYLNNSGKWYDAFQLTPSTLYTMQIIVLNSGNALQLGVWLDYDNNGVFNTTNEQLALTTNFASATGGTALSFSFTTPATWAGSSNFVRMRISTDLSTIYGVPAISASSSSFTYGQAEDYPVYLTGGVVPVSLLSFTGTQSKDAINLSWKTAQEINTNSYDIERSIKAGAFSKIGNMQATGSAIGAQYTFRDADIAKAGDYLYRLKIKDNDGSFRYSNILKFTVEERRQLIVEGNPFTDRINMLLPYSDGTGLFRLLDATGRLVYSNTIAINGSPSASLKLQNVLPAGMYILDAVINGEHFTQRVFKK